MPVLLVSKDSGITDISGLTGKTVAVQMETTADFIMQEQIEGGLDTEVKQFEKVINAFDEIKAGHVDAVCTDSVVAVYYLGDEAVNYNIVWESDTKEPIVICMKKGNEALAEELNKAMASLFESGKIKEIAERYFGSDITEGLEAGFTGK